MARIFRKPGRPNSPWVLRFYVNGREFERSTRTRDRVLAEKIKKDFEAAHEKETIRLNEQRVKAAAIREFRDRLADLTVESVLADSVKTLGRQMVDNGMAVGGVYFLRSGRLLKIGFTTAVHRRLSELDCGSALKLELLGFLPGPRSLETRMHRAFRHLREKGEWFSYESPLVEFVEALIEMAGLPIGNLAGGAGRVSRKLSESLDLTVAQIREPRPKPIDIVDKIVNEQTEAPLAQMDRAQDS